MQDRCHRVISSLLLLLLCCLRSSSSSLLVLLVVCCVVFIITATFFRFAEATDIMFVCVLLVVQCQSWGAGLQIRILAPDMLVALFFHICLVLFYFFCVPSTCGAWRSSVSLPGGNQVDGLPPAPSSDYF